MYKAYITLINPLCKYSTDSGLAMIVVMAVFFSLAFPLYAPATSAKSSPTPETEAVEAEVETINLNNTRYVIPPPWSGHKLREPQFTSSSFRKIPPKFTKNNSNIYIVKEAHESLLNMLTRAESEGVLIQVESGYRSKAYQKKIFLRLLNEGRTFKDIIRYVAPPGYSEHMLGRAVDFSPSNWRFADTPQYKWLQENAYLFNFKETYPQFNHQKMPWEAWHWNYGNRKSGESTTSL